MREGVFWSLYLTVLLTISGSLQQDSYGPVRRGTTRTTSSRFSSNRQSNNNRDNYNGNSNTVYSSSNLNRDNDNYNTVGMDYTGNRNSNNQQQQQYDGSTQYGQSNNRRRPINRQRTSTPGYQDYADYDTLTNSGNDESYNSNNNLLNNGNRQTANFNQQQNNRRKSNAQSVRRNSWAGSSSGSSVDDQESQSSNRNTGNSRWNSNTNYNGNNNRVRASGTAFSSSQNWDGNDINGSGLNNNTSRWSNLFGTSSGNNNGQWSNSSSANRVYSNGVRRGSSSSQQGAEAWQLAVETMRGGGGAMGADGISKTLENSVPGTDYPTLSVIPPTTNFRCDDRKQPGFYADPDERCQVFRRCDINGNMYSFLCPNATLFNQVTLTCDWFYNVQCDLAVQFYDLANSRLYNENLPLLGN